MHYKKPILLCRERRLPVAKARWPTLWPIMRKLIQRSLLRRLVNLRPILSLRCWSVWSEYVFGIVFGRHRLNRGPPQHQTMHTRSHRYCMRRPLAAHRAIRCTVVAINGHKSALIRRHKNNKHFHRDRLDVRRCCKNKRPLITQHFQVPAGMDRCHCRRRRRLNTSSNSIRTK